MTIDISDNNPRISYTVAESVLQTSFVVPFEFYEDEDLNVYVDDDVLKTLTTDYTTTGGSGETGTVVMNVTGATGGSTVVITRSIELERSTDFPNSGPFNIAQLNTELDKFIAIAADLKDTIDRSVSLADYQATVTLDLIPSGDKLIGWNAAGTALENKTPNTDTYITMPNSSTDNAVARFDGTGGLVLQDSALIVDDNGDITSQVDFLNGTVGVGDNDVTRGTLNVYGAATTDGGRMILYAAADQDTNNESFELAVSGEDFQISDDDSVIAAYDHSLDRWRFNSADFTLGTNDTTPGKLIVFGGGAAEAGGIVQLNAAADHDTSNEFYQLKVDEDDFAIQDAAGNDLIKLTPTTTEIANMGPTITRLTSGSSATHNLQPTTKRFRIRQVGGGGAGGGADSDANNTDVGGGGGGGAGAFAEFWVDAEGAAISSFTYTIGGGGSGNNAADGDDGGDTIYTDGTNTITSGGGEGGEAILDEANNAVAGSGAGGTSTDGSVSNIDVILAHDGARGHRALIIGSSNQATADAAGIGGNGGSSPLGSAGGGSQAETNGTSNDGADAAGFGAGGGGGATRGDASNAAGGDGAGGVMIVEEYPY